MRFFAFLIQLAIIAAVALFAVNNRAEINLNFWPLPYEWAAPLYLAMLAALGVGFLVGVLSGLGLRRRRRPVQTVETAATPPAPTGRAALPASRG